jgi:adenosylmethionine-8-amino-7-oxononanoate aminotransferase
LPIAIKKGKGALLWDENNKEYIDAIASWWVNLTFEYIYRRCHLQATD